MCICISHVILKILNTYIYIYIFWHSDKSLKLYMNIHVRMQYEVKKILENGDL